MSPIWTNWAGQQRCAPAAIDRPRSEPELLAAVRQAADAGRTVRVVGSGHSFSDIACTDGHMLSLGAMNRVLQAETASGLVTAEAGITLAELGSELAARSLAMENQGDIDRQALAGALSTATHGTGARFTNLSAQVAALRIVTGAGELVELSEESDPDGLLAARVGLGCLGAVSAVTVRCVPLFTLRRIDEPKPLADTLGRLDELADAIDHFEFYVFPYSDVALTRSSERTDGPPALAEDWRLYLQEVLLENRLVGLMARTGRRFPPLIPHLNRGIGRLVSRSEKVDRAYRVYASRRDVRFTEMEYAIPRGHAREAVERVLDVVERRRLSVGFPIEVRFVAADDALLSPAYGRDTCYIAVHQFRGMEYEAYFRSVEAVMDDYQGRPHWGKRHYQSAATLAPRYPEWDRFQAVRARLDPQGRFENDYAKRVLGPVGATAVA